MLSSVSRHWGVASMPPPPPSAPAGASEPPPTGASATSSSPPPPSSSPHPTATSAAPAAVSSRSSLLESGAMGNLLTSKGLRVQVSVWAVDLCKESHCRRECYISLVYNAPLPRKPSLFRRGRAAPALPRRGQDGGPHPGRLRPAHPPARGRARRPAVRADHPPRAPDLRGARPASPRARLPGRGGVVRARGARRARPPAGRDRDGDATRARRVVADPAARPA